MGARLLLILIGSLWLAACAKSGGGDGKAKDDVSMAGTYVRAAALDDYRDLKGDEFCIRVKERPITHGINGYKGNHPDVIRITSDGTLSRVNTDAADALAKMTTGKIGTNGLLALADDFVSRDETSQDVNNRLQSGGKFEFAKNDRNSLVFNYPNQQHKAYTRVGDDEANAYLNAIAACAQRFSLSGALDHQPDVN